MMRSYHSFLSFCLLLLRGMRAIHARAEEVKFKAYLLKPVLNI